MNSLRILLSRLGEIVFQRSRESRIDSEIEDHIGMLAESMMAKGMSRDDARLAARKQFGNVDRMRMTYREQRGFGWLETVAQDIRFAFRILTRERGFALTAIVVLGLGIGVNNMFFTLVYAHKLRGLPIADPDRILSIAAYDDRAPRRPLTLNEFQELRDSATTLDVAAHSSAPVTVGDEGRAPDRFDVILDSGCLHGFTGKDRTTYRDRILDWLAGDGDYVLSHFDRRHLLDWRPIGPRRIPRGEILALFSPGLAEKANTTMDRKTPLPIGPVIRVGTYWFKRNRA